MQTSELITAVSNKIDDSSYSDADILAILNRGVLDIAGGGQRNFGLPLLAPLPDLMTSATVSTDTSADVSMPSTFQRDLFRVVDSSGDTVRKYDSFIKFLDVYPGLNQSGTVNAVCLKGRTLYYQGIPSSSVDLTVWFYQYPTELDDDTDEPSCLPAHLHYRLLVNFACMEIFNEIEDGIEGAKQNTNHYMTQYQLALNDLHREIGAADADPQYVEDESDYITDY